MAPSHLSQGAILRGDKRLSIHKRPDGDPGLNQVNSTNQSPGRSAQRNFEPEVNSARMDMVHTLPPPYYIQTKFSVLY